MYMPFVSRYTPSAMVSTVDNLATEAGVSMLRRGGSAADAAIAANAVMSVTLPNQCGLGGDLFALVYKDSAAPYALNASGRSGSGADAGALRRAGHAAMPLRHDVRSATVPGCVDGWFALHERFGKLPMSELLAPATGYAVGGFPASYYLAQAARNLESSRARDEFAPGGLVLPGQVVRRPSVGRLLARIGEFGRDDFYMGEFGQSLIGMGDGLFTEDDLRRRHEEWVDPIVARVWGKDIWTPPPNSQGYIALSAAWIAERLDIPSDAKDPAWAHLLIESVRQAAFDRPLLLHAEADGKALLDSNRLLPRAAQVSRERVARLSEAYGAGGTTHLCAVDDGGMAVSLIQSNGMSFGSRLPVGDTGVWLQNRGFAFSLTEGHPAKYGPNLRPPHTLSPILITNQDKSLHAVLGTRGGDSQPQILLQLISRLLDGQEDPAAALAAGRWVLRGEQDETAFNTWGFEGNVRVALEGHTPKTWAAALTDLGHRVELEKPFSHAFGHAQVIVSEGGRLVGAADPRALAESVGGY